MFASLPRPQWQRLKHPMAVVLYYGVIAAIASTTHGGLLRRNRLLTPTHDAMLT